MPKVRQIVGLDLGARSVRAVWVGLQGGVPHVMRAERMELPLEGAENTDTLIRAWLSQHGLIKGFASVAIQGTNLVFQPGRILPDDPRTPRQVAEMDLARFSDMVGESMAFDVTASERPDSSIRYLMAMARPSVISQALDSLRAINVRPCDLIPAPAALFAGFALSELKADGPCMIVDVGATKTEIAVGDDHGLLFCRAFAIGGRHFTEAIAKGGACPMQQADTQKTRDASLREGAPFSEFLLPVAERWFGQFSAVMAAFRSSINDRGLNIATIILSGGGSRLDGFREWLSGRIASTGQSGDASRSPGSIRVITAQEIPPPQGLPDLGQYGVAYGLALASIEAKGVPRLSLIPGALRDEVVFREKKPFWLAAAITFVIALGVFTASLLVSLGREARRMDAEKAELRRREKIDKEIAAIRAETEALRKETKPLRALLAGGAASRYAISLVASSIAPQDWISLLCDEETYLRTEAPKPAPQLPKLAQPGFFVPGFRDNDTKAKEASSTFKPADAKPAPAKSSFTAFIIEGYTPDMGFGSVDTMMRRMRSGERVKNVDLLSDDKVKPPVELPEAFRRLNIPEMRRFVIRMEVSEP